MALPQLMQTPGRFFERYTSASVLPLPNSTTASRSFHPPVPRFLIVAIDCDDNTTSHYTIKDIYADIQVRDIMGGDSEDTKLMKRLRCDTDLADCHFQVGCGIGPASEHLLTSQRIQKPDVQCCKHITSTGEKFPVVLIEVESSNNVQYTVNKVANGIMSQILHLRRCGKFVTTMKGFFIPVNERFAEEVTGTFKEKDICFTFKRKALELREVVPSIAQVWNDQKNLLPVRSSSSITLPLSPGLIQEAFGNRAYQIKSGLSIVIHDPGNCFYKRPLTEFETLTMFSNAASRPELSVYPLRGGHQYFSSNFFFVFPEMLPPLRRHEISIEILIELVNGTIIALQELHGLGYAHNDLRLENICFRRDGSPVLIDLDRCQNESSEAESGMYGNSTMYTFPATQTWTFKKLDYRQLSIMILYIRRNNPTINYHEIEVDDTDHDFLKKMFREGMLNVVS